MAPDFVAIIHAFVRTMVTAVSSASLYSLDHPQVARLCAAAQAELEKLLTDSPELSLLLIDNEFVSEGTALGNNMYMARFAEYVKARGIGHLKFTVGISRSELRGLIELLRKGHGTEEITSTEHIRFGKIEVRYARGNGNEDDAAEFRKLAVFAEMPTEDLYRLMEIYDGVRRHRKLKINGVEEIVSCFIQTFKEQVDPILAISPLKALDEYTFTHATNVCILNIAQAMALGIEGRQLHEIGIAAMLHDMGKLFIPEEILIKPGKLDEHEWEIMRQHPARGAQYLLNTPGVPQMAVLSAFEHHLYYNLSGYPKVHKGWEQHLCSQMTAVSDFYDALRSIRSYQDAVEYDEVARLMLNAAGKQLHPLLVKNFLGLLYKATKI